MLRTCFVLLLLVGRYVDDWLRGSDFCGIELDLIFSSDTGSSLKVFYADAICGGCILSIDERDFKIYR
jgi:hypothetical protein